MRNLFKISPNKNLSQPIQSVTITLKSEKLTIFMQCELFQTLVFKSVCGGKKEGKDNSSYKLRKDVFIIL